MTDRLLPVGILGTGISVPDRILTNADIEKMVETSDEWITTRTGIKERRIADPGTATSDLAMQAAKAAMDDAGLVPEQIGGIIVATVTPDMAFPSTACIVQAALGLPLGPAFDISAGCSGFVYALSIARSMVAAGTLDNVLVIGAEVLSRVVNWQDRGTCILFGDGSGAAIVSRTEVNGILSTRLGADGSKGMSLSLPGGGSRHGVSEKTISEGLHYIHMTGNEVFKFAVRVMGSASLEALELAGLDKSGIDLFIPHQANLRIMSAAAERLELPPEKMFVNVDRYGNTSAASIPIALHEARMSGRVGKGDRIVTVGFGAGLTWGAAVIELVV